MALEQAHSPASRQFRQGEPIGRIIGVSGSKAKIGLLALGNDDTRTTVSKFVMIYTSHSRLIGLITDISLDLPQFAREQGYRALAELDLMGEITTEGTATHFSRGVSEYPVIGDRISILNGDDFRLIYKKIDAATGVLGTLRQDSSIEAYADISDLLSKHFAVLGATGVGKSCGIVAILREVLRTRPDVRIFLLDAHNEYGKCFGDQALLLNPRNLKLPFWLFNFEEIVDVFFGGRPGIEIEMEILTENIPRAKIGYLRYRGNSDKLGSKRADPSSTGYTADTPVPYVLADLVGLIDEQMGKLENRSTRMIYHKLIGRIERVDPRYAFMFENANVGGDTIAEVLIQLFRLVPNGKPMTIMQLAGFPAEVVDAVVSVLGRLAFDFGLWSDGAAPLLFVCEEAHRYASADRKLGFGPTRGAVSRIAKEGRKYGVYLGLISQRPAELDPTILSQCSSLFVMRLANDRDQEIVRRAVSDAAANLIDFVPTLSTREAFAFGEGVVLPTRLMFPQLPPDLRPSNEAVNNRRLEGSTIDPDFVASVVERWRSSMAPIGVRSDASPADPPPVTAARLAGTLDPDRFSILKKPVAGLEFGDRRRPDPVR